MLLVKLKIENRSISQSPARKREHTISLHLARNQAALIRPTGLDSTARIEGNRSHGTELLPV